jgi:hypothetical protein
MESLLGPLTGWGAGMSPGLLFQVSSIAPLLACRRDGFQHDEAKADPYRLVRLPVAPVRNLVAAAAN